MINIKNIFEYAMAMMILLAGGLVIKFGIVALFNIGDFLRHLV